MLRQFFYTLLIMAFLGFLLFLGLYGPPVGQRMTRSAMNFLKWNPKPQEGPLNETEGAIKEFDRSFRSIHDLRNVVVINNKKNTQELDETYAEVRQNLKKLLSEMDQQTVMGRAKLFNQFKELHTQRRQLVENIITDERSLINLNAQMDEQLRTISAWLAQKAQEPPSPTKDELTRSQQFDNLTQDLKAFSQETNQLDVMRILLMRKSEDFVDQLAASNQKLEENFSKFAAKIEDAASDQATGLWNEYDHLETEQRAIVKNMQLNQGFIGDNQQKIATGVSTIARDIHYSTDDQLARFQQKFQQLDTQRTAALNTIQQHQNPYLSSRLVMQQLKETNEFRMETLKDQTNQTLSQYERLDDYRRSLSSTLENMSDELRDDEQFLSQQVEGARESVRQKIEDDRSANLSATESAMARSLNQMELLRNKLESAQSQLGDLVQGAGTQLGSSPALARLKELQERNRTTLENLHQGEDQLRSSQERQKESIMALQDRIKDSQQNSEDLARSMKERAEEQKRQQSDNVQDQMQRIRDQQLNRRN